MACEGCEQRRQKLKAMYGSSKESIANAIARLTNRDRKAEQSSDAAEQSVDQSAADTNPAEQRVATVARARTRRTKLP
ncbi:MULTISPECIES: hypothetical protein [Acinetobacter]|uniref:Uncharacterized protein n=1 Tax=Acinetobacter tianfuensis TaxID=2419603 RepID=A0A3A8EL46_9GAMM|nr:MULTISPECIES: hypothetical protein [Acinetobacter]MBI1450344.1 hypothetical protein [Acinetobacter sp. FL51]RKG31480.1 hypothetical protein D7V32_08430 [Acinetobacter tianfuensis]